MRRPLRLQRAEDGGYTTPEGGYYLARSPEEHDRTWQIIALHDLAAVALGARTITVPSYRDGHAALRDIVQRLADVEAGGHRYTIALTIGCAPHVDRAAATALAERLHRQLQREEEVRAVSDPRLDTRPLPRPAPRGPFVIDVALPDAAGTAASERPDGSTG